MARPTKFTPESTAKIIAALRNGCTRYASAGAGGVNYRTLLNWIAEGSEAKSGQLFQFFHAVEEAEAEAAFRFEGVVSKAASAGDVKTALEWLKRRRREDWGDNLAVDFDRRFESLMARIDATAEGEASAGD